MVLVEENFDLIIAITAFLTLLILIFVVFQRNKFLNWFFALFFGTLGGFVYFFRHFNPVFRTIADLIYLFVSFSILGIAISDYFKFVKKVSIKKYKLILVVVGTIFIIFIINTPIIYLIFQNNSNFFVLWILLNMLIIVSISNIIYLVILIKDFSVTKLFFFLSIFFLLLTNISTAVSFFGSQIWWDLSYFFNIITYAFFIACSLTVYFEDQLIKISSDLNEKENLLQTFIELAPVGVILFQEKKVQLVNTTMSNIIGIEKAELINVSIDFFLNSFDKNDKIKIVKLLDRSQKFVNNDFEDSFIAKFTDRQGKIKWGQFYAKTTMFQDSQSNLVIIIDITEKYLLEEKFKLAFVNSPHPIVLVDGKSEKFILFNDKFLDMFGYSANEIINYRFDDFTLPEDLVIQQKNYSRDVTHTDGFQLQINKKYKRKDGSIVEAFVSTIYLKISDENEFFVTQLVDISYLNELEYYKNLITSLEQANNELKSISQIVSHDVKAPLYAINNLLDLIEFDFKESIPEDLLKIFSQIKVKTNYTSNLVKEILDYSSVGFFEDELEIINTKQLIEEISKSLTIPENITLKIDQNLPKINASKIRIQQVFQNLLSNAIKFNDKSEGKINISFTKLDNKYYEFFVEDNGIGIPEKDINSLFQVFKTLRRTSDSSGLGLAIVKKIIEYYGGDVHISSILGSSTKVFFTLPGNNIVT